MKSEAVVLSLVCPGCGRQFSSAMQMAPSVFEQITLGRMLECCPHCDEAYAFSASDYLYRSPEKAP